MAKIRNEDFLFTTGRIRSLERELLGRERIERMIDAKTDEDALKILYDCGYQEVLSSEPSLEDALARFRRELYVSLESYIPVPDVLDVFRLKYDFHNIKTAVKAAARGYDAARLYIDAGTVPIKILLLSVPDGKNPAVPAPLNEAIAAASDTLARTGDPQLVDFELDRAMFVCQARVARETGSDFLSGYVALSADAANLRALSRARRMGRGRDLLRFALSDEGTVAPEKLLDAAEDALPSLYSGLLSAAAAAAAAGAEMSSVDRLCDDALVAYIREAKFVTFGEQPAAAYLAAREFEMTQIRIIMAGRASGLSPEAIRERLRSTYV